MIRALTACWAGVKPAPYSASPIDATITSMTTLPDMMAPFSSVGLSSG